MVKTTKSIFLNEVYAKPSKKIATWRTDGYYIGDAWRMDLLDLKDYGPKKTKDMHIL